ncbi:MAG: acetylserotonin O-methyltransferase [Proteobacteria bacterium]|nr:acetylserotonin O-methyltransferase [Pseudomonadota bacterium]
MKELKNILSLGRVFWDSQVLLTSVKLKIFDYLGDFNDPKALSKKLKVNERALKMLLDALSSLGFLEKKDNLYKNRDKYAGYLVSDSEESITSILIHYYNMWNDWGNLIESIKTGKPNDRKKKDQEESYHFINGMDNLTKFYKNNLISNIDFMNSKRILDIGSGPATYLREMLKKNEKLKGVILDLPQAILVAKQKLKKEGLINRVRFIEGGVEEKDFGSDYDIILISQVLHALNRSVCKIALEKSFNALKKGGKIYIHEFYLNERRTAPKDNVIFCLNMLIHSDGGDNFTISELKDLVTSAGFFITNVIRFKKPPTVLVEGVKNNYYSNPKPISGK